MKLYEAKNIITEVFENPFDKDKFSYFIRNLLKNLHPAEFGIRSGNIIPPEFRDFIASYERIGKYKDEEGYEIDVLIVNLKRDHSLDYARSTQRNFIRWYLKRKNRDAALVAFHTEKSREWRFSFIKMQYSLENKKDELTPAKRSSFMVGESGKSHTAQRQFIDLLKNDHAPCLSDIEDAFSIEAVSDEFYEKYKALLFNLVDEIEKIVKKDNTVKEEFESKNISILNFSKKLLGQIVFLYFLQKKGWLGLGEKEKYGEGDKNFLRSLFNKTKPGENFFNDYLEYLFYDALSKKRVTDYYERFNTRIPFLNGGLFDPIEFYDWQKTDIVIPNEIFSTIVPQASSLGETLAFSLGENEEAYGILDVFDLYNFTVKEDEPLETEVAIDPEMLGKVFERMLDVTERKSKGAFYTPREIVHYMAQQSLLYYLVSQASSLRISNQDVWKTDLETFIHYGEHIIDKDIAVQEGKLKHADKKEKIPDSIKLYADTIDKALENIKICDPAVGSGAFPVGIMNEIVKLRKLLTPFIVSQASSLSENSSTSSLSENPSGSSLSENPLTLRDDDFDIIYFDKNAETEIHERDLPHWCQKGVAYFVTFRLSDSIPDNAKNKIKNERENWLNKYKIRDTSELKKLPKQARIEYHKLFSKRYDELLDSGYGSCILANPEIKEIVENALKYFDGKRYFLDEFIVMPNHVHVIVVPKENWTLDKITHSWKSFTANEINKFTGNSGQVWMHESFDHIIRSEKQLHKIRQYIKDNQTSNLGKTQAGSLRNYERSAYRFKSNAIQNSIYGVDIDAGAVEIAKLRLWLSMVVDEERIDTIEPLPNLEYKIVQGNSLINIPDGTTINDALATEIEKLTTHYFHITDKEKKQEQKQIIDNKIQEQLQFVSEMVGYKIDFDFKLFFHEVWKEKKGFDVVIGNPPYVKEYTDKSAFYGTYGQECYQGKMDLWYLFGCKGIDLINSETGLLTFIATNNWTTNSGASKFRNKVLKETKIHEFIDFGDFKIFDSAGIQTMVMILQKTFENLSYSSFYSKIQNKNITRDELVAFLKKVNNPKFQFYSALINKSDLLNNPINFLREDIAILLNSIKNRSNFRLNEQEIATGIDVHQDFLNKKNQEILGDDYKIGEGIFNLSDREIKNLNLSNEEKRLIKPFYTTNELHKYYGYRENALWLIYTDSSFKYFENIKPYPRIKSHLDRFKDIITSDNKPYGLHRARDERFFKGEKIISLRKCISPTFTYTDFDCYVSQTFFVIKTSKINQKYLTAILNSELIAFWLKYKGKIQGDNYQIDKEPLLDLPLFKSENSEYLNTIVDYILFLKSQSTDKMSFYFEQLIDGMVYELYFENEIKQAGCDILKYLDDLPEISDEDLSDNRRMADEEKLKIITKVFNKLYDESSPVRKNLEKMEQVEEVKIIKESLEK
jgi:REP element-mobilizing transposase RayT